MIVVIDDSIASRMLVRHTARRTKEILSEYGIDNDVEMFDLPDTFLHWINDTASKPNIILIDYNFKGKRISLETIEKILHHHNVDNCFIIGWSSDIDAIDIFQQSGIHGFISKESPNDLSENISIALSIYKNGWFELL